MKLVATWTCDNSFTDAWEETACFEYESAEKFLFDLELALDTAYEQDEVLQRSREEYVAARIEKICKLPGEEKDKALSKMFDESPRPKGFIHFCGKIFHLSDYKKR